MKIAVIGHSGSGKSTLAALLGRKYGCPVLHLDSAHFSENWTERSNGEMNAIVGAFLQNESWVIDGNYMHILFEQRMEAADRIIYLNFDRFSCLSRVYRRWRTYKGHTRPELPAGCEEKLDREFIRWVLWEGRTKKKLSQFRAAAAQYPYKTVVIRNQRDLDRFKKGL